MNLETIYVTSATLAIVATILAAAGLAGEAFYRSRRLELRRSRRSSSRRAAWAGPRAILEESFRLERLEERLTLSSALVGRYLLVGEIRYTDGESAGMVTR
jgi:hypothetical protein